MPERVGGALLTVAWGCVTGAFGAAVFGAALARRMGDPRFQGLGPRLTILAGAALFVGMAVWLVFWTPFV